MKLWSGRFSKEATSSAEQFGSSVDDDARLYAHDIAGSLAHAKMLAELGVLSDAELGDIQTGLGSIKADIESGAFVFSAESEDVHMNIEQELTRRIGDAGKKLHTARSRNDQVAVDLRLYQKDRIQDAQSALARLGDTLVSLAERHIETVLPGYTHLQHAQPVTLAFHLMAYCEMLLRDLDRLGDCYRRTDVMPLGSGALAGTSYETDREFMAKELGFSAVSLNAMDAVSDRDFALEFTFCCSAAMMHLSRLCEELILWSSQEFGFIELDDAFATGSSIMPQKKNPDTCELVRGKTGRVFGDLMALLTVMKSLPLAYNKDMQEDKRALFDAGDTLIDCANILAEALATMRVDKDAMRRGAETGFMNATDAADYLVHKGVAFRESHEIVGRLVARCLDKGCALEQLSLDELRQASDKFGPDIFERLDPLNCIAAKRSAGGVNEQSVKRSIERAKTMFKPFLDTE